METLFYNSLYIQSTIKIKIIIEKIVENSDKKEPRSLRKTALEVFLESSNVATEKQNWIAKPSALMVSSKVH